MRGASPQGACYLVEWYRLELGADSLERTVANLEGCAAATTGGSSPVTLLAMLAVPTDEVVFGVFAAESPAMVADLCHQAGIPAQRLTAAFDARNRAVDERSLS